MTAFTYHALPARIVFGAGTSDRPLADEAERLGCRRILVVAASAEQDLARRLVAPFADRVADMFGEVRPHVPVEVAERARDAARRADADALLCVGGGSTTGTAKAVALETGLPIVAVPTTYAGSEVTPVWGLTDGGRKRTGRSMSVLPRVVVYDPELTLSLPPAITGPSGMNALAHCVEAFYAPHANPVTGLMAEEGIRALGRGLPAVVDRPDDLSARTDALYGAYFAGAAFAVAGSGLHHKTCHALGGAHDLPHAETHAIVLPHVVAFNAPAMPATAARIARALGVPDAATGLYDLAVRIGAPTALADLGMREEELDGIVPLVLDAVPDANPRPVDEPQLRALLTEAWTGRRPSPTSEETTRT